VGLGFEAHVTLYDPLEKSVTINAVKLDFSLKSKWILDDSFRKYYLDEVEPVPKGSVREVDFSSSGIVIKYSTSKGVYDGDGNVYAVSNFD